MTNNEKPVAAYSVEITPSNPGLFNAEQHLKSHIQKFVEDGVLSENQAKARLGKDRVRVLCGYSSCGYALATVVLIDETPGELVTPVPIKAVQLEAGIAPVGRRTLRWQRSSYATKRAATGRTLKNRSYPEHDGEITGNDAMTQLFEPLPQVVKCPKCKFSNQLWQSLLESRWLYVVPATPSRDSSRRVI